MKKIFTLLTALALIMPLSVTGKAELYSATEDVTPSYDWDIVVKNLEEMKGITGMKFFFGSNSLDTSKEVEVSFSDTQYGTYTDFDVLYDGKKVTGELTYSYSDELLSDLIVVVGTWADGAQSSIRLTMYSERLTPTDEVVLKNLQKVVEGLVEQEPRTILSNVANDTVITIVGCDGSTYGKYSARAVLGELELTGKGSLRNEGADDVFEATLFNADTTKIVHLLATTPAPAEDPDLGTGMDNLSTTLAPTKQLEKGQVIIISNGVKYNLSGAIVRKE